MKRVISILLAIVFICSAFVITTSAEDDTISEYEIVVVSTEYAYDTCRIYADAQDKYYMSVYDITRYTRSTYTESNGKIKITHGTRELTLDVDKKSLVENSRSNDIDVITYNNQVLVHAAPLLTYLGATCDVSDNRLVIAMPSYTLWEALELTGDENYIRAEDAFGSELEIKTRLLLNGILKFMDSGFGDAINAEYSSVLLALQVDVSNYDKYFDIKAQDDIKNLNLFQSMVDEGDALDNFVDFSQDMKEVHRVISIFKEPKIVEEVADFGKLSSAIAISSISSISETLKTSKDSFDIISATTKHMSEDARFYNNLNYAQKKLKSTQANIATSMYSSTILKAITEELSDNAEDIIESNQSAYLKKLGKSGKLSIWKTLELSLDIAVLLEQAFYGENSIFNYADAETNVIELLRLKQDLVNTINSLAEKITAENYSNTDDLEDFRLLRVFYYRTLIAINEQFEAMIVAQWGKENQPEMRELIATLQNQSNLFAEKLYMLTVADTNSLANIENVAKDNAWDEKKVTTVPPNDDNSTPPTDEFSWEFDQTTGTVIISGTGELPDYHCDHNAAPWDELGYYDLLKHMVIKDGITEIGSFTFAFVDESVTIPKSVTKIRAGAFADAWNLQTIYYQGTEAEWNSIEIDYAGNSELNDVNIVYLGNSN